MRSSPWCPAAKSTSQARCAISRSVMPGAISAGSPSRRQRSWSAPAARMISSSHGDLTARARLERPVAGDQLRRREVLGQRAPERPGDPAHLDRGGRRRGGEPASASRPGRSRKERNGRICASGDSSRARSSPRRQSSTGSPSSGSQSTPAAVGPGEVVDVQPREDEQAAGLGRHARERPAAALAAALELLVRHSAPDDRCIMISLLFRSVAGLPLTGPSPDRKVPAAMTEPTGTAFPKLCAAARLLPPTRTRSSPTPTSCA